MQEFNDGTFGEITESDELLKKLLDDLPERERTKAIHFGTREELDEMKRKRQAAQDRKRSRQELKRK